MNTPLIDAMQWRHATKSFDAAKKVSDADLEELLEALRLSASSYGTQPWAFIVVTDQGLKDKLSKAAYDQRQVRECSHLVVLASFRTMDEAYVDAYIASIAEERGMTAESLKGFRDTMANKVRTTSPEDLRVWMEKQTYIALGTLLTAAALKKIDSCPMEGFDKNAVDEILGLEAQNLHAVTMCPLGYRGEADYLAIMKKVRWPKEKVIIRR